MCLNHLGNNYYMILVMAEHILQVLLELFVRMGFELMTIQDCN